MHALSSAAVAMAVTRGCSRGELERCGCDRKVRGVSPEGESKEPSGILHRETSSALFHRERLGTVSLEDGKVEGCQAFPSSLSLVTQGVLF